MPQVKALTVYTFDELDEDAKETARSWYREGAFDYEWWDSVYEDSKTIGALMGISVDRIYFSGFWSQGDGACFEGSYEYAKGAVNAVKDYAPKDTTLHQIARDLQNIQRPAFYQLSANVKHHGHYQHAYCTDIDVHRPSHFDDVSESEQDGIAEGLRDFMNWIYSRLKDEYEYMNLDEQVDESIQANEYEFMESGRLSCA